MFRDACAKLASLALAESLSDWVDKCKLFGVAHSVLIQEDRADEAWETSMTKDFDIFTDKSPSPNLSMALCLGTEDMSPPLEPLMRRKLEASVEDPTTLKILITRADLSWPDCSAGLVTKRILSTLRRWQPWWFHFG